MNQPFALRFAHASPPQAEARARTRIASIKGLSRMSRTEIALIAAGGIGINPFDFTEPQYTQFGPEPDEGDPDWDPDFG